MVWITKENYQDRKATTPLSDNLFFVSIVLITIIAV